MSLTKISGSILKDPLNLGEVSIGGTLTYQDVTNVDSVGIITARSTIDAQGSINLADSIIHTGDTDTKIRFPSADTISFETSGNERFRITSAGSVGINQDNPHALLSLGAGVNAIKLLLYDNEDNNKYGFGIQTNELRQFYPDDSRLVFGTISRSNGSTFNEKLRITSDGKLGIGTDNPSARFDVEANASSGYIAEFRQKHASNSGQIIIDTPADNNVRPASIDLANAGTVKWSLGQAYSSTSSGAFHIATSALGANQNGAKLTITTGGNVGVGTNNPAARLHVQGNTEVRDARGNQNLLVSESGFKFNQSVSNWSTMTYTASPVLAWDYKSGPGDLFYIGSGGNTAIADQMALVVSDAHGIKIGKSGYDGSDFDISSSNEFFRVAINGSVRAGNNASFGAHTAADDLVVGSTSGSNGMTILTGSATGNIFFNDGSGNDGVVQYVHSENPNYMRISSSGWIRLSAGGNNHGGGIFTREKTCTTSGTDVFRFYLPHGALAGTLYAIGSNNANSVSKVYAFAGHHGSNDLQNIADSGSYGGNNFTVSCSSSGSTHTFSCTTTGANNVEISFTFHMGAPNQDLQYTEL